MTMSTAPRTEGLDDQVLLASGAETGEQIDVHRVIGHALAERVEMLLREDGGGHEHGHLPAVHHRFERGANGNFGLAEADVAADQTIHGLGFFQVRFGFQNRAHLVGRFLIDECAFEFALPRCVGPNGVARLRFARSLDGEQLAGKIAYGLFRLRLRFGPARAAQRVERRPRVTGADVFADEMRLGDRHVKSGRPLVDIARRVIR